MQSLIDQDDAYTQQQQSQQQAASEQSLIDQDEAYTQQQQSQQQAADQQQAAAEDQARADEQQAASEQSLIDQDTAYTEQQTQQQAAEAERVAYTQEWLPFYADLAGGSQAEGIQTLNQEYDAGVRNPIEHRYNQIAASLQSQLGAIPSELHRETDRRLRQLIGEKWYNIYRGIDDGRPTPQQRAARAAAAAEKIVEGDTDGEPDPDSEGTDGAAAQQASTDTSEEAPEQAATQTPEETEETPDTPPQEEETEVRNPARVGEIVVGYETDATTAHRVRPVLGDLDDVIPSHSPTGEEREEYPQGLQPRKTRGGPSSLRLARKRAENPNINQMLTFPGHFRDGPPLTSKKDPGASISGSGRRMTAEIMRDEFPENWEKYQAGLRLKLEELGMDPAEADAIAAEGGSPFLHYELIDDTDEVALARDSNKKVTQGLTASEVAEADTEFFDAELMGLWQQPGNEAFGDAVTHADNAAFRKALMDRIPDEIISEFMTEDETQFSPDGIKRLENAIIMYVFQGETGSALATALIEQGLPLKNIEHFLRTAIASLAYAKANGQDISTEMAAAVFRFLDLNNTADDLSRERKQPKEPLLYGAIEALYRSQQLIDGLTLIEKQLLYLIYSKRDAYTQLAEMLQDWSSAAVTEWLAQSGQPSLLGDTVDPKEIAAGVFTRIIRDYITSKVFETRETRDGETVLLSPESMPAELVDLREDMDALSTTEEKMTFASEWVDEFFTRDERRRSTK